MAEAAVNYEEYRYASNGSYANPAGAAYAGAIPLDRPAAQPAVVPRVKPRELPRRKFVSMPSVLGFLVLVFLAGVYLVLSAQLTIAMTELYATKPLYITEASGETQHVVGLETQRDALIERTRELKIEYERTFDLGVIERYATEKLGMIKAPKTQSSETKSEDRAVIPAGADESGILGRIFEYVMGK